ncbi:hypothetical protein [Chryseobacterium polytrichastri]|uniref:Uncharacterized protein n=1 Tax=Chryseobacterium polytrichastri TaxID=1302687 RepID=A0A1M6TBR1_9FLAO|nr:hypothetical protein [Chryseobacterium polytrichastri]SHK54266.1 hypothetical protein SAMN05444267_100541 [Chryseobacterium polytrichastri]
MISKAFYIDKAFWLILIIPILMGVTYIFIEFLLWAVCRLAAYLSYHILKYFFVKSQKLNPEKPLKPLLLIIQTISLIIPPIIVFIKELLA